MSEMKRCRFSSADSGQAAKTIDKKLYEQARELYTSDFPVRALKRVRKALAVKADAKTSGGVPTRRDGYILLARILRELRRFDECRQVLGGAVESGQLAPDDPEALITEYWIRIHEGRCTEVIDAVGVHIVEHQRERTPLLGEFLFVRGAARRWLCQFQAAKEDLEYAHFCFRLFDQRRDLAAVSNFIGSLFLQQPNYSEAIEWFKKSRQINESLQLSRRIVDSYQNIGIALYKLGRYDEALVNLKTAVGIRSITPDRLCRARIALGNVYRLQRNFSEARRNLTGAYTLAIENRIPREECIALEFLGDVYRDDGNPDEARRYYRRAMAVAISIAPEGDLVMELLRREGECHDLAGHAKEAIGTLNQARVCASKLGDRFEEGVIERCLALANLRLGQHEAARGHIETSVAFLTEVDARHELAISRLYAARIHLASADLAAVASFAQQMREQAWQHAVVAQTLFMDLDIEYWSQQSTEVIAVAARRHLVVEGSRYGERASEATPRIVAESSAMQAILKLCGIYANDNGPVLITGETGTGKGLIARHVHTLSYRAKQPFIDVNCAAIPRDLVESELFGHEKGSFTGADRRHIGKFEQAQGGTLFLDEIGDMSPEAQAKVLKAVEEGRIQRVGGTGTIKVDVRIVAATNKDLRDPDSCFRDDLYFRLSILEISIPPLRERAADILPLLDRFLSYHAGSEVSTADYFGEEASLAMLEHTWPGNVREIIRVAHQAVLGRSVNAGGGSFELGKDGSLQTSPPPNRFSPPADTVQTTDHARLLAALRQSGGNKAKAARLLGVDRKTIYNHLRRFGIAG